MASDKSLSAGNDGSKASRRLFLALWPGSELHRDLYQQACEVNRQVGGRLVRKMNIHLTLHFLGEVAESKITALKANISRVESAGFDLVLDQLVFRQRQNMLWATPSRPPASLLALHDDLASILEKQCGFAVDSRPFLPHVTLLKKLHKSPAGLWLPLQWRVNGFCLVESVFGAEGVRYEVLHTVSFAGEGE